MYYPYETALIKPLLQSVVYCVTFSVAALTTEHVQCF